MNVKEILKSAINRSYLLRKYTQRFSRIFYRLISGSRVFIENHGICKLVKDIKGKGNKVFIGQSSWMDKTFIRMHGNNNQLIIGAGCSIGPGCSFWLEGNDCTIEFHDKVTITRDCHFCAQEDGSKIIVGGAMLSNNLIIRTSDSHPIYDTMNGIRINLAKDVIIGEEVWIAPQSIIMKGVKIGDGSIIGSRSFVTKDIPANCLAVGAPARVVKENIKWTREKLF